MYFWQKNNFKDTPFDMDVDVQVSVDMGLFEPVGVHPTHQNVSNDNIIISMLLFSIIPTAWQWQ